MMILLILMYFYTLIQLDFEQIEKHNRVELQRNRFVVLLWNGIRG